ncbi:uncharacterized protein LOC115217436 isoform X1 [Octopus sinensis]|uniref:Uncharacterized protein LOC115217436 isoform X1 n=1 Tax=Octopus sinensis TaxID=2607531 RepID=A0A6P7SXE1_9MOLL|nr:uncharacterized protein LOC115217436 isoform X1 [Octopus sinensis]XP_036363489.1 uncharacterized protein LOC115217436 isoform X1 [Octopus sinensis]
MQSQIFFYDQAPNRPTPKRYRKYNSVQAPVLSGAKTSPTSPTIVCLNQKPNFSDGPIKKNLLPELTQTYISLRNRLDSSLTSHDETQRHLYEQSKASSEEILDKLAIYFDNTPNLAELVPKSLEYQLMCSFKEFTTNVVVVPRQWQTAAMREQAKLSRSAKKAEAANINTALSTGVTTSNTETHNVNSELTASEFKLKKRQTPSPLGDYGDLELKLSSANTRTTRERACSRTGAQITSDKSTNIHFSLASTSCWRKGYAVVSDEISDLNRRKILIMCVQILQKAKETMRHSSFKPMRIYYEDDHHIAKYSCNLDKKFVLKPPHRSVLQKSSKPLTLYNVPIPNIPIMEFYNEDDRKTLLKSVTDDGTSVIYYRSGNIAVIRFRGQDEAQGFCTLAFDDAPNNKILLNFLPNGCGWCLYKNGNLRMFVSQGQGYFFNENYTEVKHLTWSRDKIVPKTNYKVTTQIYLHCSSQAKFSLHLKIDTKHLKFNLTPSLVSQSTTLRKPMSGNKSVLSPCQQTMKGLFLMTSGPFASSYAKDLLKGHDIQEKQIDSIHKKYRKSLDMSPEACFEMIGESELQHLQKKARSIVNSWMNHYQVTIGLKVKSVCKRSTPIYQSKKLKQTCPAVQTEIESMTQRDNKLNSISITVTECDSKEKQNIPSVPDACSNKGLLTARYNKLILEKAYNNIHSVTNSDVAGMTNKKSFIQALEDVSNTARKLHALRSKLRHDQVPMHHPPRKSITMKSLAKCVNTLL